MSYQKEMRDVLVGLGGLDWRDYKDEPRVLEEKHSIFGRYFVKVTLFSHCSVFEIFKKGGRKAVAHSRYEFAPSRDGIREAVRLSEDYVVARFLRGAA